MSEANDQQSDFYQPSSKIVNQCLYQLSSKTTNQYVHSLTIHFYIHRTTIQKRKSHTN